MVFFIQWQNHFTRAAFGRERKIEKPLLSSATEPDAWEISFLNKDTLEEIDKENSADKVKSHDKIVTSSFKPIDRAKWEELKRYLVN